MKTIQSVLLLVATVFLLACSNELLKLGQHYQKNHDYQSLQAIVDQLPADADTTLVRSILGEPIDMGFDYRYLLDSMGPNGCVVGAVFHISEGGLIDQKWIGEICE